VLEDERTAVCETAKQMTRDGLVVGTSGNVSIRAGNYLVVTPTGVNYALMRPEDVTVVTLSGEHVEGALRATSELPLHLAACAAGATAVVHTHAVHATAVSTLVDAVPPVHYLLGLFGGSVRVAPYATYGTRALADGMLAAMAGRTGCVRLRPRAPTRVVVSGVAHRTHSRRSITAALRGSCARCPKAALLRPTAVAALTHCSVPHPPR